MDELMERYEKLHQAIRRVSKNRGEYVDDVDMLVDAEEEFLFSNMNKKVKIIDKKNNQIIL